MIRIIIKWDFLSPILKVASGTLIVEDVSLGIPRKLLIKCKVKKELGISGYKAFSGLKGIPHKLFEELKPTIDTMVNSYFHGMLLEREDYEWINDSADKTFEKWAEEKGLQKGVDYG